MYVILPKGTLVFSGVGLDAEHLVLEWQPILAKVVKRIHGGFQVALLTDRDGHHVWKSKYIVVEGTPESFARGNTPEKAWEAYDTFLREQDETARGIAPDRVIALQEG